MKYEIEFISKIQDAPRLNMILMFGDKDAVSVAKKCFEYGKSGNYVDIRVKRIGKIESEDQ